MLCGRRNKDLRKMPGIPVQQHERLLWNYTVIWTHVSSGLHGWGIWTIKEIFFEKEKNLSEGWFWIRCLRLVFVNRGLTASAPPSSSMYHTVPPQRLSVRLKAFPLVCSFFVPCFGASALHITMFNAFRGLEFFLLPEGPPSPCREHLRGAFRSPLKRTSAISHSNRLLAL